MNIKQEITSLHTLHNELHWKGVFERVAIENVSMLREI